MRVAVLRGEKEISIHEESRDSTVGAVGAGCWRGNWKHSSAHRGEKSGEVQFVGTCEEILYTLYCSIKREEDKYAIIIIICLSVRFWMSKNIYK